jgi:flagellar biosynthesis GTPase FlhF
MLLRSFVGSLVAIVVLSTGSLRVHAQMETTVRVVKADAAVRSRASLGGEVVAPTPVDTVLIALDREGDWLWVLLPPNANGTRRPGWIRTSEVELIVAAEAGHPAISLEPTEAQQRLEARRLKRAQAAEERRARRQAAAEQREQQRQAAAEQRVQQQQAAEERRLQEQQAAEERRAQQRQAAEEKRLQQQRAAEERRVKQQQAEEEQRLEKARRELEKAKQDFEKVNGPTSSASAK